MSTPPPASPATTSLTAVEQTLRDLLEGPVQRSRSRVPGRPPILPALALWAGLLVGILRGVQHQADIWRLLTQHGLWDLPRFPVTDRAVYDRLERLSPAAMKTFFEHLTVQLHNRFPAAPAPSVPPGPGLADAELPGAQFPAGIYALDHTVLDPVLRKRKLLRELAPGDKTLLPGALGGVFDVRRQLWVRVDYLPDPQQDLHGEIAPLITDLPSESLLLFDLGYFAFWWLDQLTDEKQHFVTRVREKTTSTVQHCFYDGGDATVHLWDGLVYLGKYRADQAAHPVRLIELTVFQGQARRTYRYLTNVLDPQQLAAWEVIALYRQRWDIERAFDLIKTHLGLQLLWSSIPNVILQQVYATFSIAQIVLGLRNDVAAQAGVGYPDVSLELLVRWLPRLAAAGRDPLAEFVQHGRTAGYIRPCRKKVWVVPRPPLEEYQLLATPPPERTPRYGSRKYCAEHYVPNAEKQAKRGRYWDFDLCRKTV